MKSNVLILIIGSANKRKGGFEHYDASSSILSHLTENKKEMLISGRKKLFRLIKEGGIDRSGNRFANLPQNVHLCAGPDFGGINKKAQYLPAAQRFSGSFYTQLLPEGYELLINSPYHILIITPLYGLLTTSELIQDHDCDINDHKEFRNTWTYTDLLTDVLIAYISKHGINKIIDLTAVRSFRNLLNWSRLKHESNEILHCFGNQIRGDRLLTPLGGLIHNWLIEGSEICPEDIRANMRIDLPTTQVLFYQFDQTPKELPKEFEEQVIEYNNENEIVWMGRCVRRMLHNMDEKFKDDKVLDFIDEFIGDRRIPPEIGSFMKNIHKERNAVEHYHKYHINADKFLRLQSEFREIVVWANKMGIPYYD